MNSMNWRSGSILNVGGGAHFETEVIVGECLEIDLAAALDRLGGQLDLYEHLYGRFRRNAVSLAGVAEGLAADGLRSEAAQMYGSLSGIARVIGANALEVAAVAARDAMALGSCARDEQMVSAVSNALLDCFSQLDAALAHAKRQPAMVQ